MELHLKGPPAQYAQQIGHRCDGTLDPAVTPVAACEQGLDVDDRCPDQLDLPLLRLAAGQGRQVDVDLVRRLQLLRPAAVRLGARGLHADLLRRLVIDGGRGLAANLLLPVAPPPPLAEP